LLFILYFQNEVSSALAGCLRFLIRWRLEYLRNQAFIRSDVAKKKHKVVPYSINKRRARSWPRFLGSQFAGD